MSRGICAVTALWSLVLGLGCGSTQVETTHYVGVFDPYEQVAQELYRVKIRGNSPWYSSFKFGSGWVPASVADLLALDVSPGEDTTWSYTDPGTKTSPVSARRRFFEMGPLGVSTEPLDSRFVIAMGSDPDDFFRRISLLTRYGQAGDPALQTQRRKVLEAVAKQREALLGKREKLSDARKEG